MSDEEYYFLTKKEFEELGKVEQWHYVESIEKLCKLYKIGADKNCEECEKQTLAPEDINIDFIFEDWRECSEHCDKCNKPTQIAMCDLQYQLINHLAEAITTIRIKLNNFIKGMMTKDEKGEEFMKMARKKFKDQIKGADEIYR